MTCPDLVFAGAVSRTGVREIYPTFLLMLSPKDELTEQEYAAKDIVFVFDTSGSMADAGKMEKARAALLFGIRSLRPDDRFNVVSFAGDGCFLMYAQELATAKQFGANVIVIVVNNGMYGTIRMHQERRYPGRVVATDIVNPDMVALAHSFGAFAERVDTTPAFPEAFQRALSSERPALLDLRVDPLQIAPAFRLS